MITFRFEKRSEIHPAVGEKSTNGRMMIAASTVLISLALAAAYSGLPGKSSGATAAPRVMSISLAALSFSRT